MQYMDKKKPTPRKKKTLTQRVEELERVIHALIITLNSQGDLIKGIMEADMPEEGELDIPPIKLNPISQLDYYKMMEKQAVEREDYREAARFRDLQK